jgi:hypothetical protein
MTIEHVENNSSSLKVYLQKIGFKEKVEHVKKLGSKVDLQKMKVEHVEEGSTSDI